jgi:hypothetical protein
MKTLAAKEFNRQAATKMMAPLLNILAPMPTFFFKQWIAWSSLS